MKIPVKDAVLHLLMKNSSGTDIRRYKVILNSMYKPLRYELEMRTPVNQPISQPIPLINITSEPNYFTVTFTSAYYQSTNSSDSKRLNVTGSSSQNTIFQFVNEKETVVAPREQRTSELTFNPDNQQTYTGLVKVENITTGQLVEYEVIGVGEEPVAEERKFSQFAGETKKYEIKFELNSLKNHKCNVIKCSLPSENIEYEKSLWVNGSETSAIFKFIFKSKFPKIYEGRIHIEDDGKVHAYQVKIAV